MSKCVKWFGVSAFAAGFSLVVALAVVTAFPLYAANERFSVPDDLALRIRLDDTLTSVTDQSSAEGIVDCRASLTSCIP